MLPTTPLISLDGNGLYMYLLPENFFDVAYCLRMLGGIYLHSYEIGTRAASTLQLRSFFALQQKKEKKQPISETMSCKHNCDTINI